MAVDVALMQEVLANLVGAFAGFSLALLADRRYRRHRERQHDLDRQARYQRALESILGSVAKNTAAARQMRRGEDASFELEDAVWTAVRDEFIDTAPTVDERVVIARFFEHVDRLEVAADRVRELEDEGRAGPEVVAAARARLAGWARDLELAGKWLIADHGSALHRQLLEHEAEPTAAPADGAALSIQRF